MRLTSRIDRGDQPRKQALAKNRIRGALGMPLHAEVERPVRMGDGLDQAVRGTREDEQFSRIVHGLLVSAVNRSARDAHLRRDRIVITGYDVVESIPVSIGRVDRLGKVLLEVAAIDERHELHPEAHAEHGHRRSAFAHESKQRDFVGLTLFMHGYGLCVRRSAELLHARVVAPGQHKRAAVAQMLADVLDDGGQEDGHASGVGDGLGVRE